MKSSFTPPYGDEAIIARLDGEIGAPDALRFEAAFREDRQLAARTAELKSILRNYQQAFAPLLEQAPSRACRTDLMPIWRQCPRRTALHLPGL